MFSTWAGLDWRKHVKIAERYKRPLEVDSLIADTRKSREKLGWEPQVKFKELVAIMVDADVEAAGLKSRGTGKKILEAKLSHWNHWHNSVTKVREAVQGQAAQN